MKPVALPRPIASGRSASSAPDGLHDVLDRLPLAIAIVSAGNDGAPICRDANAGFAKLAGEDRVGLLGLPLTAVGPTADATLLAAVCETLADGTPREVNW